MRLGANAKKVKKDYSYEERVDYYGKRMYDDKLSKNQQIYARQYVDGAVDTHADHNLEPVRLEYKAYKKLDDFEEWQHPYYRGAINGRKMQVEKSPSINSIFDMREKWWNYKK